MWGTKGVSFILNFIDFSLKIRNLDANYEFG
jgi:hypothetical protein